MPALTTKEKAWREWLTTKLKQADVWDEFTRIRLDFQRAELAGTGQCIKIAGRRAWHKTSEMFTEHFNQADFESRWAEKLKTDNYERKRNGFIKARESMVPAAKAKMPKLTEQTLDKIIDPPDDEVVVIANSKEGDLLRDTKWVYFNLARLIKVTRGGIKKLDNRVLQEAPSNGAVGLAQYALDDQKAFFEKFVTKILPRDEAPDKAPSEEKLKAELDPSFDDLKKYMKKLEQ